MGRLWNLAAHLHTLAGPATMLLYPLYASVIAMESTTKVDDEQWLAYWILYSFLTLAEMLLQPLLEWIPIWYDMKLAFVVWLVLPQFKGAAFIYDRLVRQKLIKRYAPSAGGIGRTSHDKHSPTPSAKIKNKFADFMSSSSKKGEHEASS